MGYKVGIVAQKGGVGKSTIARALGTSYAAADWDVKIADLDINQSTSYTWLQRRLKAGITPVIEVQCFGTVAQANKHADNYDLFIFDGAPSASRGTEEIAKLSDLIILPTGLGLDDLEPTVMLANSLAKAGINKKKISFALCRVGDSLSEIEDARNYLLETPYYLLDGVIPEKTCLRQAQDDGFSVVESRFKGPRGKADHLVQSIMNRIEELTN